MVSIEISSKIIYFLEKLDLKMNKFSLITFIACSLSYILPIQAYFVQEPTPVLNHVIPLTITETTSGLDQVDCIYVINLDHRPERWNRTKTYFKQWNCFPNRISAVNGGAIPKWEIDELRGPYDLQMNLGAVGCLMSHLSIYKDAYDRGFNTVWICEDDIELRGNIRDLSKILTDLTKIDPNWDVLYTDKFTGGCGTQWTRPKQPQYIPIKKGIKVGENIYKMHGRFRTHSMIFSRKGLRKALHYFSHVYVWSPIDVDIHYVPGIREYSVKNDIVTFIPERYSDTEKK